MICKDIIDEVIRYGHSNLHFQHPYAFIIRKSQFICLKTLMIRVNKGAKDLNRDLVIELHNPASLVLIELKAKL
ncbi:MAG: DUF371 domain-containing protein [Promethearchaeota archaeon]